MPQEKNLERVHYSGLPSSEDLFVSKEQAKNLIKTTTSRAVFFGQQPEQTKLEPAPNRIGCGCGHH